MVKFWKTMGIVGGISTLLVLAGALNWLLVTELHFNLVLKVFGSLARWVYDLVGVAALYSAYALFKK